MPLSIALGLVIAACVPRKRTPEQEATGAPSAQTAQGNDDAPESDEGPARAKPAARRTPTRALPSAEPERQARASERPDPLLSRPFRDSFEREGLGPEWRTTSGRWNVHEGQLCVQGARNHPLWLKQRLPRNARIEFDAVSYSADGDIKAEFWGDGKSAAASVSYTNATSYLTIFGGWKNQFHVLARIDEHAPDRQQIRIDRGMNELKSRAVEKGMVYHFKVERNDGKTVRWLIDDLELFVLADPKPLAGPGHNHFGFNNWDTRVCFDNLVVTPLPG